MSRRFAGLLVCLLALPLAADDEFRSFKCPRAIPIAVDWPPSAVAESPDQPRLRAKLQLGEHIDGEATSFKITTSENAIECSFRMPRGYAAEYTTRQAVESGRYCPELFLRFVWPGQADSDGDFKLKLVNATNGTYYLGRESTFDGSAVCTYAANPATASTSGATYRYPFASADKLCTRKGDTLKCTLSR